MLEPAAGQDVTHTEVQEAGGDQALPFWFWFLDHIEWLVLRASPARTKDAGNQIQVMCKARTKLTILYYISLAPVMTINNIHKDSKIDKKFFKFQINHLLS